MTTAGTPGLEYAVVAVAGCACSSSTGQSWDCRLGTFHSRFQECPDSSVCCTYPFPGSLVDLGNFHSWATGDSGWQAVAEAVGLVEPSRAAAGAAAVAVGEYSLWWPTSRHMLAHRQSLADRTMLHHSL